MRRHLVLITGASSGIGAALAREFAANGWDLALTARRQDRLEALAEEIKARYGVDSLVIPADLSKASAPKKIIEAVEAAGREIDGLVNNAGFGLSGTYTQTSWKQQADFLQLMLGSYAELVHRVMPGMQARGHGRILNVASVAGLMPGSKGHTLYAAVKSALIKFSQSLHFEGKAYGIHATALCPGFTYSEFHDVNETRDLVSKMPSYWWLTAEQVAEAGFNAVQRNQPICVPGLWYKFLTGLNQILPTPASMWLMERNSGSVRRGEEAPDGAKGDSAA
ncbi:SDR family oxidoreductase [uncultured Maricaulis sp.]|uniref:SDR family NAD(P)-dependent oxidoreductase n=1 Tax=uncultured Maricaulis sp. TaxID=174710 RepID=UPI0030DCF728|tara:strand:+ start:18454 stop:19290 length:837 start_codon:yes stop_codon:yes gene_type:complete